MTATSAFRRVSSLVLCSAILVLLAACGVKPPHVDPPPGNGPDTFPRTYPSPDEE